MSETSSSEVEHETAMRAWCAGIERRAAGTEHAIARGISRRRPGTAPGAYRAEGRVQCAEQMDIWACVAEATAEAENESTPDEQQ